MAATDSPPHNPEDFEAADKFLEIERGLLHALPASANHFYELVKHGKYDDDARCEFILFAEAATGKGIAPIKRGYTLFKPMEIEKYKQASIYMNDLRLHDLQWVKATRPGHKVDDEALDGVCWGIFDEGGFDYDQAYKIAEGSFTTRDGKSKNITDESKVKNLCIPSSWQEDLVILRSKKVKADAEKKKISDRKWLKKNRDINTESIAIRERLEAHSKKSMSRMKNIDTYVNIWKAYCHADNNWSNLKGIMAAYESLANEPINISVLRDKIKYLRLALT